MIRDSHAALWEVQGGADLAGPLAEVTQGIMDGGRLLTLLRLDLQAHGAVSQQLLWRSLGRAA